MRIIDISKEVFSAPVYPGDPQVAAKPWYSMAKGDICNLHALEMGTHTGTHLDAPLHFIKEGRDVSDLELEKCVGTCQVVSTEEEVLDVALLAQILPLGCKRLLIKGKGVLTPEGAAFLVREGLYLLGTENNTVGDSVTGPTVHRTLLGAEMVILENLELGGVPEGEYTLCAQPLKLGGMDGSPVRAVLLG